MSVDYTARLMLGHKITEEQYNYIGEHYDIIQDVKSKYDCAIDAWCVMEHSYFFGIQLAFVCLEQEPEHLTYHGELDAFCLDSEPQTGC